MNTSFKVNTAFSALDYVVLVDQIAAQHFDNGEYAPHLGLLNTMKIFMITALLNLHWMLKFAMPKTRSAILPQLPPLASNSDFIEVFNAALTTDCRKFDFANAYAGCRRSLTIRSLPCGRC